MSRLRPLGDRLIVKPVSQEKVRASGLVLPDVSQEKPQLGVIEAAGPEVEGLSVGEEVVYSRYGGTEIAVGDDKVLVLRVGDVLAVHEPVPAAEASA